ncbi:long-chain fatty acid--CoA ligase [Rhodococcus erythropolis]|uniref:AMP-dependent synthetase/ligase n=1 Tax=Rhodococcus erythropolis TaxID=1833 RepID=UPI001F170EAC|nr:long-chain fatty acid--CoA ligase [Rhodococcus erythropolis]UJC81264.1 long-chain fatty acid--CoA ligase [Rhodococcus erythropolis]
MSPLPLPATICEAFQATVAAHPDRLALRSSDGGSALTWSQYGKRVRAIAEGFASLGVKPGDTVALMLTNRPEFHLCDMAALHAGATPFSIYNTNPPETIAYLFGNADNSIVICEEQFLPQIRAAIDLGADLDRIICVDADLPGTISLAAVESTSAPGFDFEKSWKSVGGGDLLTVVYTSGTTGPPKGVELTHTNMIANYASISAMVGSGPDERVISYLPDAHAANRWLCHYAATITAAEVTTVARVKDVVGALTDVRPTIFFGVPHTWYKVKTAVEGRLEMSGGPMRRAVTRWAIRTGRHHAALVGNGLTVPALTSLKFAWADRLVLSKVRAALGLDRVRIAVTSAAPIAAEAHEFLLALGLPVCEAWGMSEMAALATFTAPSEIRVGTVGRAIVDVEVAVASDGELLVRGPNVMRGYRKDLEKTAEAIDSRGWLRTGDIGSIDDDGYVRILDRKKELIINSSGKNMSPTNIEGALRVSSSLIGAVAVIGDRRPFVTALIVLDDEACVAFAESRGIAESSPEALVINADVVTEVEAAVARANATLSQVEKVRAYTLLATPWMPGGDELTPTLKLKRSPIATKYADAIEQMYRSSSSVPR